MRSQLGETCRILGFVGQVVCHTETSAVVEFEKIGFLTVLSNCEGKYDSVISMSVPKSMSQSVSSPLAVEEIKRQVCLFFDLVPQRVDVKLCTPLNIDSQQPFVAELVDLPSANYPDWPNAYAAPPMPAYSYAPNLVPPPKPEELYSVPRRYDLSSMFAISVAYALLFSVMSSLRALPSAIFLTGVFCAIVGAAQALLFGGKKPREASMLAGGVGGFLCVVAFGFLDESMSAVEAVPAAFCSIVCGPVVGYAAGTAIGGIWLVADYLRQWSESRQSKKAENKQTENKRVAEASNDEPKLSNDKPTSEENKPHPLD